MYFDTHAHYDDSAFDDDRGALLPELYASGVGLIIDPGCDVKSSRAAIALAEEYSFVYAAVGIHPEELAGAAEGDFAVIRELAAHDVLFEPIAGRQSRRVVARHDIALIAVYRHVRRLDHRFFTRCVLRKNARCRFFKKYCLRFAHPFAKYACIIGQKTL